MWFKNLRAYRLTQPFDLSPEQLDEQLAQRPFEPCGKTVPLSMGWTAPLGDAAESLVHAANGCFLICIKREERLLPGPVVKELLEEKVATIEEAESRKVYRKERLNLKDEIVQDCLPRAFTRSGRMFAFIDTRNNWIFVDAASAARAEELLNLLRDCIGSFPVLLPQVNNAPSAVMTGWLAHQNLPEDFELGTECELRELGEEGGVVRVKGVDLLSEEVEVHLNVGKQVAKMALHWDERLSLVLAEDLCLRRLKFSEELMKESEDIPEEDDMARLDADFALMSATVGELQERVIALFGGEAE